MLAFGLSFYLAAVGAYFLNWLALIPWRNASGLFWTGRAALLYPARVSAALNRWLILVLLVALCGFVAPDSSLLASGIGAYLGAILGALPMDREVFPELTYRRWLHLVLGNLCLGSFQWVVLFALACAVPSDFGTRTWFLVGIFFLFFAAWRLGLALTCLKWVGLLRKPTARLSSIVERVSREMGIPVRATWIWRSANANASAFTNTRELAFTEKLLDTLSDEEIGAVCAHELGHLNEGRMVAFGRFVSGLWVLPALLARPIAAHLGWEGLYGIGCGVWVLMVLLRRVFRRMEIRADKMAAERRPDSKEYARALELIYRMNQMPVVQHSGAKGIHPNLYDRLVAIGSDPEYPRPPSPAKMSRTTWVLFSVVIFLIAMGFGNAVVHRVVASAGQ
jgi:Zn-dependent protease with chaperone function